MTVDEFVIAILTGIMAAYFVLMAVRFFSMRRQPVRKDSRITGPWIIPQRWVEDEPDDRG